MPHNEEKGGWMASPRGKRHPVPRNARSPLAALLPLPLQPIPWPYTPGLGSGAAAVTAREPQCLKLGHQRLGECRKTPCSQGGNAAASGTPGRWGYLPISAALGKRFLPLEKLWRDWRVRTLSWPCFLYSWPLQSTGCDQHHSVSSTLSPWEAATLPSPRPAAACSYWWSALAVYCQRLSSNPEIFCAWKHSKRVVAFQWEPLIISHTCWGWPETNVPH